MNLFFLHPPAKKREDATGKHTLVTVQEQPQNANDGSEFPDDAIRMAKPFMHTEESVAAGSPENFL